MLKNNLLYKILVIGILCFPIYADAVEIPNGLLVKSINDPKVYYIENGLKRHIESPQMLISQFRWEDLVVTTQTDLDSIPTGSKMQFREGSLLAYGGTVYIVSNTYRRPIDSGETFLGKGYKWENVISVSDREIEPHPIGEMLTSNSNYPDGSLIYGPTGHMYVLEKGQKRYIPSPLIFEARYRWSSSIQVSQAVIDSFPTGENQYYPDGLLISSDTSVFLMQNNQRLPIGSAEIFESYGLNWNQVRRATDYELSIIAEGPMFGRLKNYSENSILKAYGSSTLYIVKNNELRHILSPDIFNSYGYNWQDILQLQPRVIDNYPKGGPIGFNNGSLIADRTSVYLIEDGKRRPIGSDKIFLALGYRWENVRSASDDQIALHPLGELVGDVTTANLQGYQIPSTSGKTAREQHLPVNCNETPEQHYANAGTRSDLQNGLLSSGGAFSSSCPSGSRNSSIAPGGVEAEKYYITMRWNYVNWYEARTSLRSNLGSGDNQILVNNATQFPSTGYVKVGSEIIAYSKINDTTLKVESRGYDVGSNFKNSNVSSNITITGPVNANNGEEVVFVYKYQNIAWRPRPFTSTISNTSSSKAWHTNKKVLVTNPKNGRRVVASIIESGPAIFTDRVSGLSPEAMDAIGAVTDDVLEYGFVIDQNTPLGSQ